MNPSLLFFLLILACPIGMMLMMRSGHGGHAMHGHGPQNTDEPQASKYASLEDLHSQRDALDEEIARRHPDDASRPRASART